MYLEYLEGIRIKSLAYYHLTAVTMKNVYFCFKAAKKKEHPNIQTAAFFEMSRITKMTEKNTFKIFFLWNSVSRLQDPFETIML